MKRRCTLLIATILLLWIAAACSRGDTEEEAPPTELPTAVVPDPSSGDNPQPDAEEPAAEQTATDAPAAGPGDVAGAPPSLEANALEQLSSYRSLISWSVTAGGGSLQRVEMEVTETSNPEARQISIASDQGDFRMVQAEGKFWINAAGQWQEIPAAGADATMGGQILFTPEELSSVAASGGSDFEFLGAESVNGIQANRFRLNLNPAHLPQAATTGEVRDIDAEIWVADQPNLPIFAVRMTIDYVGIYAGQADSNASLRWEVTDINSPDLNIPVPPG